MKLILIVFMIFIYDFNYYQTSNDIKEIITYGTYAPNSHNAQMWSVKIIGSNRIKVFPNYNRVLPFVDPNNRETWISLGAFVENCILSAQDLAYNTTVTVNKNEIIIDLTKDTQKTPTTKNIDIIQKRLTVRTPFLNEKIDETTINKITNISENIFYFPKETLQGEKIIENSIKAYSLQMEDTSKLKELSKWMSFSYREERKRKDGLTPRMLGMSGVKHFFFNAFMFKKSVTGNTFIKGSIKEAKEQLNSCSGFIIITTESFKVSELVQAGRDLESVWLKCIENTIAVHPMSQVLEEIEYNKILKKELNIKGEIQMVLRIGKVKNYPELIKRRIDVNNLIKE